MKHFRNLHIHTLDSFQRCGRPQRLVANQQESYATVQGGICFWTKYAISFKPCSIYTGGRLHSRAACTQPCKVNTHSRAHCSPGARLCQQWGHGCVNNGARLCASARLCRGSPVCTRIVVFWHISNISPMILKSQICIDTATICTAAIFVKYCYTTGNWLL